MITLNYQKTMKTLLLFILAFFLSVNSYAQIDFQENIIQDGAGIPNGTNDIKSADIDNDGDLDLIVMSNYEETIAWFENLDGNGNFGPQRNIITGVAGLQWLTVEDMDGDNDLDVIFADTENLTHYWIENSNGLGNFSNVRTIVTFPSQEKYFYFIEDFDGDNDMDILCGYYEYTGPDPENPLAYMAWYENTGTNENFVLKRVFWLSNYKTAVRTYVEDMDLDGDSDIVVIYEWGGGATKYIIWYENNGLGDFSSSLGIGYCYSCNCYLGDIEGDGDQDLFLSIGASSTPKWIENLGNGSFSNSNTSSAFGNKFYDLNNDGFDDSINCFSGIEYQINIDGNGEFSVPPTTLFDSEISIDKLIMADINGDGNDDIVFSSSTDDCIAWMERIEPVEIVFSPPYYINKLPVLGPEKISAVDIDGDTDMDVVVYSVSEGKVSWFENTDGQGNYSEEPHVICQNLIMDYDRPLPLSFADLDGDNDLDLIVSEVNSHEKMLMWYENIDGQGNFGSQNIIDNNFKVHEIAISDLDNDGDMDIISRHNHTNLAWFENINGIGNFGSIQAISNSSIRDNLSVVDVDNDGFMDVIYKTTDDEIVWIRNIDGGDTFSSEIFITEHDDINKIIANDFDGDNDIDVVYEILENDTAIIKWIKNDGQGNFTSDQEIISHDNLSLDIITADIDDDNDQDIVLTSEENDDIVWYKNIDGYGHFGSKQIIADAKYGFKAINVNDLNNDGKNDVLLAMYDNNTITWYKNNGLIFNKINGNVSFNINNDGCEESNIFIPNILVTTESNEETLSTLTLNNGVFQFFPDLGNYTTYVDASSIPEYYTISPDSYVNEFETYGITQIDNFCTTFNQTVNNLKISLLPVEQARPGFETKYLIGFENIGSTILDGAIELEFDISKVSFNSASEGPSNIQDNIITFSFNSIKSFEKRNIEVIFNVLPPPTNNNGDIISYTTTVFPIENDYNEDDNTFVLDQTLVGSYDPNDISVLEGEQIYFSDVDKYLHYIIRFQNTGTADAINIEVTNVLDPNLDWRTLQLENSSHPNRVEIKETKNVSFSFNNIHLPDSISNEPKSHGFIAYRIKPLETISVGDVISNEANIIFDFNPSIKTNTVTTEIVDDVSTNTPDNFSIYPNPTSGVLTVYSSASIAQINIINSLGQLVLTKTNENNIDLSKLNQGLYFVKITDINGKFGTSIVVKK